ncbi:Uncharacterized protein RDABS01_010265, partial [Bienertia sinuspersici]
IVNGNYSFFLTCIYGFNDKNARQPLYDTLQNLHKNIQGAQWCVIGDFNAIMSKEDWNGAIPQGISSLGLSSKRGSERYSRKLIGLCAMRDGVLSSLLLKHSFCLEFILPYPNGDQGLP